MAARSIATLTVSFGMVSIPVKLFSATEASRAISFNLLHKTCGSRLKQQYICVKEEVAVAREDMAKGYEFEKDQYVMFSPEELKALEEAGTHTADIAEFVPIESIDPVYFDKAYYLAPDKGGAKPYALLARPLGGTRQAVHRDDPARRGRSGDATAPLRRRSKVDQGNRDSEDRSKGRGAQARAAAYRAASLRQVRSRRLHRRRARADRNRGAEESGRPGDHYGRGAPGGRAGHRPHGSAAREPRQEEDPGTREGARSGNAQGAQARPAARARRPKSRQEINPLRRSARDAPRRRARGRAAASPAPQHDQEPRQCGFCFARAGAAQVVPVLVPGPDRAADRAGARRGERAVPANHEIPERASPPSPRRHAALGAVDRRGRRPRGRLRRSEPLAGGIRPVPARLRRRSGRRLLERDRARRRRGGRGAVVRAGVRAGTRRCQGRAAGV